MLQPQVGTLYTCDTMIFKSFSTYMYLNTLQRQDVSCSNFVVVVQIFTRFEFDACNTFQKRLGKLNGLIGVRCLSWLGINEHPQKAPSFTSKDGARRASPLCEQLCGQIVQQFENNVSQRAIWRNLWISSSTVQNTINRSRESGEICARQGRMPTLDGRDLRSLRRHCIKSRHHSDMEITTWAQEYFRKPSSVNTVLHLQAQVKTLPCKAKAIYQQHPETPPASLGPELIWDGNVCRGLTNRFK